MEAPNLTTTGEKPTIKAFLLSFGGQWLTKMSGPFTVPFAIAALFVPQTWQKALFACLAILCAAVSSYGIWAQERRRVNEAHLKLESRPRIVPRFPNPVSVTSIAWNMKTPSGEVQQLITSVIRIRFLNDPQFPSTTASAQDVIAKVTFIGARTFDMDGRWTSSDQPSTRSPGLSRNDLLRMSFGIGAAQDLDIAAKYPTGDCWALNNDSYNYPLMQKPGYELHIGRWKVNVRLLGTLVEESFTFYFESSLGHLVVTQPDDAALEA